MWQTEQTIDGLPGRMEPSIFKNEGSKKATGPKEGQKYFPPIYEDGVSAVKHIGIRYDVF